ncbi:hypothetical protein PHMEG_00019258 [Phytophthora megakarya]|uniref:Bzip transcription factor n=1 Tax=Phytophthora megakarya TaxID=4795 RepID=A0A225VSD4_9STRA|nr:hypothetical protein PHMEG_00019258 [Phytophthora megakarya]
MERTHAVITTKQHIQRPRYAYPVQVKSTTPQSPVAHTILAEPTHSFDLVPSVSAALDAKLEARRARGRLSTQRYRKKQANKVTTLYRDISLLLHEIQACKMRISDHWIHMVVNPKAWGVVVEYYCLLGRGVNNSFLTKFSTSRSPSAHQSPVHVETLHEYFQTILMPNVISCGGVGVEAHLTEWMRISTMFPDFNMKIVRMEKGANSEVVVTSKTALTFSENTFRNAFPHVSNNDYMIQIAEKLWGKTLEIRTVAHFIWDEKMDRFDEIRFEADLISPMLRVLGSLDLVACMFESALVSPEGKPV